MNFKSTGIHRRRKNLIKIQNEQNESKKLVELTDNELKQVTGGGQYCFYRVQSDDSLSMIAQNVGFPVSVLIALNNLIDANDIYPGKILRYPG